MTVLLAAKCTKNQYTVEMELASFLGQVGCEFSIACSLSFLNCIILYKTLDLFTTMKFEQKGIQNM